MSRSNKEKNMHWDQAIAYSYPKEKKRLQDVSDASDSPILFCFYQYV